MLITQEEILPRFIEHLSWAAEIDLATAWATCHNGLWALQRHRPAPEVRAIVGRWGNLTDPFALKTLARIGQLRGPDAGQHFHPKIFIFRGGGNSVAWVGSANFTPGGFGMNDEAVFETTDTESVQDWFDDLWERTDPLDAATIKAYADARENNPPAPAVRPRQTLDLEPLQLFEGVSDWQSYVAALEQCNDWWSNRQSWSVLGEQRSWRETAEVLHHVVAHPDWDEFDKYDRLRLLGLTPGEDWALFGRMRPTALSTVFGADLQAIQDIVLAVVAADDSAFPSTRVRFLSCPSGHRRDRPRYRHQTAHPCPPGPFRLGKPGIDIRLGRFLRSCALHPWHPNQLRTPSRGHLQAGLVQESGASKRTRTSYLAATSRLAGSVRLRHPQNRLIPIFGG